MTAQTFKQIINEGMKDLPEVALAEIVDFVFFVRKRTLQPEIFEEELQSALMNTELNQMSRDEEAHLEKEFENYDRLYPRQSQ